MPSEISSPASPQDRLRLALEATARQRVEFRSAIIAAHERAKAVLSAGGGAERAALELGRFGGGRIDAARFAALESSNATLDYSRRIRIEWAANVLRAVCAADDNAFVVTVPPGGDLRLVVARGFTELGRAFGAAATVELARAGRFESDRHADLIDGLAFEAWGKAERRAAPPLVVRVNGADLHAGRLAEFLDGGVHIVLIVDGPCAPAPLARLVSPGTAVVQTADATGVDIFSRSDGPSVMALVPSSAACFVHDPGGGRAAWQRLRIWNRPAAAPRKSIGASSARQQIEDLRQLDALAERPSFEAAPVESLVPVGSGDPTDRLASWLLDVSGVAAR
jgi:hypothetical protein